MLLSISSKRHCRLGLLLICHIKHKWSFQEQFPVYETKVCLMFFLKSSKSFLVLKFAFINILKLSMNWLCCDSCCRQLLRLSKAYRWLILPLVSKLVSKNRKWLNLDMTFFCSRTHHFTHYTAVGATTCQVVLLRK